MSDPVDHWFVASENLGQPSATEEGEIERYEVDQNLQGHYNDTGEDPNQPRRTQGVPVSCPVTEGPRNWMGLKYAAPDRSDGTGSEASRVQVGSQGPVSSHVSGETTSNEGGRRRPVTGGDTVRGHAGNTSQSLAREALIWLEARSPLTPAFEGDGLNPGTETGDPAATSVGITIKEIDLTPEDLWALLRDAGYETW